MESFLRVALCGLKRIERDFVIQVGVWTGVRIKDISMIGRAGGEKDRVEEIPDKAWFGR